MEGILTLAARVVQYDREDDDQDSKQAAAHYEDDLEEYTNSTDVQWMDGRKSKSPCQVEKYTDAAQANVVSVPAGFDTFSYSAASGSNNWSENKKDRC